MQLNSRQTQAAIMNHFNAVCGRMFKNLQIIATKQVLFSPFYTLTLSLFSLS